MNDQDLFESKTFPDISINEKLGLLELRTTVRLQSEGKWYRTNVYQRYTHPAKFIDGVAEKVASFCKEAYLMATIGVVMPDLEHNGIKLFSEDPDQRSEKEILWT